MDRNIFRTDFEGRSPRRASSPKWTAPEQDAEGAHDGVAALRVNGRDGHESKLIFVTGKGGVGKTTVSKAIASSLSQKGRRTLWVSFEDPLRPAGEVRLLRPNLWSLNCDAALAFEEYAALKIGIPALTRLFLKNKLIAYLSKAAPGIHELVMLGKIWHERKKYDHLVLDMPSTGYTLAMFQSVQNFARLFRGGPIHADTVQMNQSFDDPEQSRFLIVATPEEMPLREALELREHLQRILPNNEPTFLVNRLFPTTAAVQAANTDAAASPEAWDTPFPASALDYVKKRALLEFYNLRLFRDAKTAFDRLEFHPASSNSELVEKLATRLLHERPTEGSGA